MEITLNKPNDNRNSMSDDEFWKNIEAQVDHAQNQINIHQKQRVFFIELLIAVIGFGFILNLLTSIVYDVMILNQQIKNSYFWIGGIIIVFGLSFYLLWRILTRYSPIKPRIRFELEPFSHIDNFEEAWSKTKEIIDQHQDEPKQTDPSPIIQELWDSIKTSFYDRPPYKSYLILIREIFDSRYVDFRFKTEYIDVKYQLDFLFYRWSMIERDKPNISIAITILEPYKPHADDVWDKYAILTLMMDISYIIGVGIENFIKKYEIK
jgi:hypothetical protein